jgi:UDP-N-acetylmuramoyl-tripeptide--D-alanyl-D-alanine ligase
MWGRWSEAMKPWRLSEWVEVCGGRWCGDPGLADGLTVTGISTDTRTLQPGNLYVALRGDRFDGHDFVGTALSQGAVAVMVDVAGHDRLPPRLPLIVVDDVRAALARMARKCRQEFSGRVIGVAGSNGKTTTKEGVATLLETRYRVHRSPASYNNDIGVPLTLFGLRCGPDLAVVELGTNHPGELAPLVAMARPGIGVLTQIGREHLEYFGDLEGVAREEGEIALGLPSDGVLVLGGEGPLTDVIAKRCPARVIRVGWGDALEVGLSVESTGWEGSRFRVRGLGGDYARTLFSLPIPGRPAVWNAGLSLTVASMLQVEASAAFEALARWTSPKQRARCREQAGMWLMDDSYNANPDSMEAALETFSDLPCPGRRVAVLGDMAELGLHAGPAHEEVGRACAGRVDILFGVGRWSDTLTRAASEAGVEVGGRVSGPEGLGVRLAALMREGDTLLVKGSRSLGLERVVLEWEQAVGLGRKASDHAASSC